MFDRILDHTGPLGLSDEQARQVLGMTVALVFSPERGGPRAFLQTMRERGLGNMLDSWLGAGPNQPITPIQASEILGPDALAGMARRTGLPDDQAAAAVAAILPEVVHELSEHGDLPQTPADIPAHVHGGVGNLQHYLDEVGHWSRAAVNAGAATLGASVGVVPDAPMAATPVADDDEIRPNPATPRSDGRSHLLPWLAVVVAAALAFLVLRGCGQEASLPADEPAATGPAANPAGS